MATLSAAATLTAACSSVIEQESNLNGLASAQPVALSASQSRALAFDDCNYIVDHLKVPQSAGTKSRAMSYCLGVFCWLHLLKPADLKRPAGTSSSRSVLGIHLLKLVQHLAVTDLAAVVLRDEFQAIAPLHPLDRRSNLIESLWWCNCPEP